jgi:histidyl-tRNA synthetase
MIQKPSLPKGTRDFAPLVMARRKYLIDCITETFSKYGFLQLETPAMENLSVLTGKYGDEGDKLLFRVLNSGDYLSNVSKEDLEAGSQALTPKIADRGLRYDLTVPFARFVVMNRNDITFPFKRYQIQPVWRADRPQKGRYREFYQCDADVVGTNSLLCELEIILMIKEVFQKLGLNEYSIKINHRGILFGLAELLGANGKERALFTAIDKLDKMEEDKVREELLQAGFTSDQNDRLFNFLNQSGDNLAKLSYLEGSIGKTTEGKKGVGDLNLILTLLRHYGGSENNLVIEPSLARGLSYYTGAIFELKVNNVKIGSVGGGGRYDNLTGAFGLPDVSGVGFSFGIDRLYDVLDELNLFPQETNRSSQVLITHFDESSFWYGIKILQQLREKGIASEIYPDLVKIKKQMEYANKKNIPYTILIGETEMASGKLTFKNMLTGEQQQLTSSQILELLKA